MKGAFSKKTVPVLAIGGMDPSAYSGVLADVRVFQNYRLTYTCVLSAITAQTKNKFFSWKPVSLELFKRQLQSVGKSFAGIKIGMVGTAGHVRIISKWIRKIKTPWILWDPVLQSSTGTRLLRAGNWNQELQNLAKGVDVLTPNIPEAEWILKSKIASLEAMMEAAPHLAPAKTRRKGWVLLKGGHLPDSPSGQVVDLFYNGRQIKALKSKARPGDRRGTGCAFASALLAGLIKGQSGLQAARQAKQYVLKHLFDAPLF